MTSTSKHRRNHCSGGKLAADGDVMPRGPFDAGNAPEGEGGDFIDMTIAVWQKHAKRPLTREDGREIIENMTGFFRILQEWDRAERERANQTATKPSPDERKKRRARQESLPLI